MAYRKQKDKWFDEIVNFLNSNGEDREIHIGDRKLKCKMWNKFPVCVVDVCVDNFFLIDNNGTLEAYGGDLDDKESFSVSQKNFDKYWRNLNDIEKRHIEYVKYVLLNGGHTAGMNKYMEDHPKKVQKKVLEKEKKMNYKK